MTWSWWPFEKVSAGGGEAAILDILVKARMVKRKLTATGRIANKGSAILNRDRISAGAIIGRPTISFQPYTNSLPGIKGSINFEMLDGSMLSNNLPKPSALSTPLVEINRGGVALIIMLDASSLPKTTCTVLIPYTKKPE